MTYKEIEWTEDLDKIYRTLILMYISMPSILDTSHTNLMPKLPIVFDKIGEGYERPWNTHKQSIHLQRLSNPDQDIIEFMELLDKYNLHHNIDFFHQSNHTDITSGFQPHRHKPGFASRSSDNKGNPVYRFNGESQGEVDTEFQDIKLQLTFPFIHSNLTETLWSATYDMPFKERRPFLKEEITSRFTMGVKPALFNVGDWHTGGDPSLSTDRLLFGIPSKFDSFEEGVEFFEKI